MRTTKFLYLIIIVLFFSGVRAEITYFEKGKNLFNENWNLWRDSIPLIKYKTADCSYMDNVREYIFHG